MLLPPLTPLRRFDTHRLLPAKYGANLDSVLTRLLGPNAKPEDLGHIFELDNLTNARLQAENGRSLDITAHELVFRVPQAHIVNAAFTHPHPLGARFSSPTRGAWYAGFELATSKAEVLFHKRVEFAEIDWRQREETLYDDYLADFTGTFHDLRPEAVRQMLAPTEETRRLQAELASQFARDAENTAPPKDQPPEETSVEIHAEQAADEDPFAACLSATSYVASQRLAAELLRTGSLGVLYPSVRRPAGHCLACFRPAVVANVRKHARWKLTWTPGKATFVAV